MTQPRWKPRTLAAQALGAIDPATRAVVPPLHMSTTFIRDPDNQYRSGYSYGRPDNATVRQTENLIAALEGAHDGALFGSGMAAATAVVLALPQGSHIVASKVMYWAFRNWLATDATRFGYRVTFADTTELSSVREAVRKDTAIVYIETPGNPLWTISDIAAIAEIAHNAGATLAVDSTVATPIFTQPLGLGADLVMHSATKYLNGHSDVIAGVLATARPQIFGNRSNQCAHAMAQFSGPSRPGCCMRGLRTLAYVSWRKRRAPCGSRRSSWATRMRLRSLSGPAAHPGHAVAACQMSGYGGMLSIRVKGGESCAIATAANVELWKRATSLGGVESLIEHRASVEGPDFSCPADLLRLSVGLEDADDLLTDLDHALRAAHI